MWCAPTKRCVQQPRLSQVRGLGMPVWLTARFFRSYEFDDMECDGTDDPVAWTPAKVGKDNNNREKDSAKCKSCGVHSRSCYVLCMLCACKEHFTARLTQSHCRNGAPAVLGAIYRHPTK